MTTTHSVKYRINEETMTIEELWEAVAALANGRVKDNLLVPKNYPLETRAHQLISLKALVKTIEESHERMQKLSLVDTE